MKFYKQTSKKTATISVIVAIVSLALLANWFQFAANDAVLDSTRREMTKSVEQMEIRVEESIEEGIDDLTLLAQYIAKSGIPFQNTDEYLSSQSQSSGFSSLYYVALDGVGVSAEGELRDFSGNVAFEQAQQNAYYITTPYLSELDGAMVFGISVPVISGNTLMSVLLAEISMGDFSVILEDTIYDHGDAFIVDRELNLLFSTSENHVGEILIPDGDLSEMGSVNVTQAYNDISNSMAGSFFYDYHGVSKLMVYIPIDSTEWALAVNVETDTVNTGLASAVQQLEYLCQAIYCFLILLLLYIWYSQSRTVKQLEKAAYNDPLTDLPNIAKLKMDMTSILMRNADICYSIIIFDIENFKAINEMFGYEVGDRVLKTVKALHNMMGDPSLITARVGDDRFAMFAKAEFLDGLLSDLGDFDTYVSKLYDELIPELADYNGTFKIGRYNIPMGETNIEEILSCAYLALTRAKQTKGEPLCDYDSILKQNVQKEAEITSKMKYALENHEFKVYLQPKFSTGEDKLVGAEALVRWIEDDGTIIYPNDFIPLFERNGFVVELDKFVLEKVCMAMRHWIDQGMKWLTVSVNCSRLNLYNPFFVDGVVAIADKYQIPHEYIEIELTESTTMENEDSIEHLFAELRKNGFKISIDDFGAGYSSLGMLKNLHVDTLKMDRSFFVGGKNARRDDMLIDSIVKMSHNLGMYVVAEGIETPEQVELLKSMNCDAIQGYVHAQPMPVWDFEVKYRELMELTPADTNAVPLVQNINNARYANSIVPCGILVSKLDEDFTIIEANDGYFNIIGYSREELKEKFSNKGMQIVHPDDRAGAIENFAQQMQIDPNAQLDYACRLLTKHNGYIVAQLSGKVAQNANGEPLLFYTVSDITLYSENLRKLQEERDFNARIASLTNNIFFDYDIQSKTMRFSKNFADKFLIPNVMENFSDSEIGQAMFHGNTQDPHTSSSGTPLPPKEGEFCLTLPDGEPVWYLYEYETIYDPKEQKHRTVGKMTEAAGHKLEMDILKMKSQSNTMDDIFNKSATQRYIRNYLKLATANNINGAFFVVNLENYKQLCDSFGYEWGEQCLKDLGVVLRSMFRSADIIGRAQDDKFFVFINNYNTVGFINKKAEELCRELGKTYEVQGTVLSLSVRIGISLYPEHGDTFENLYEKAQAILDGLSGNDAYRFAVYGDELKA